MVRLLFPVPEDSVCPVASKGFIPFSLSSFRMARKVPPVLIKMLVIKISAKLLFDKPMFYLF